MYNVYLNLTIVICQFSILVWTMSDHIQKCIMGLTNDSLLRHNLSSVFRTQSKLNYCFLLLMAALIKHVFCGNINTNKPKQGKELQELCICNYPVTEPPILWYASLTRQQGMFSKGKESQGRRGVITCDKLRNKRS